MHERVQPPTMDELEEMDSGKEWEIGDACLTPSMSNPSPNSQTMHRPYSRQVSRVSGLGRMSSLPVPVAGKAQVPVPPASARVPPTQTRGVALPDRGHRPREEPGPQQRRNLHRRSSSVDDPAGRPSQRVPRGPQAPVVGIRGPNANRPASGSPDVKDSLQQAGAAGESENVIKNNTPKNNPRPLHQTSSQTRMQRGGDSITQQQRPRRAPYANPKGTPSSWQDRAKKYEAPVNSAASGGGGGGARGDELPVSESENGDGATAQAALQSSIPRHASSPDFAQVYAEIVHPETATETTEVKEEIEHALPSATCWGGGLAPKRGATTQPGQQGTAAARPPAAPRTSLPVTVPATGRFPSNRPSTDSSNRYPANDRESFARTLNEEELDEVWKGLGEGVSQRGCGSEVSFVAPNVPSSPAGTGVSGAFPLLTANMLQRHDQLAGHNGAAAGQAGADGPANVMAISKDSGDKAVRDMEAGTRSSKKSSGSSDRQPPSLLTAAVSYGILVLYLAHLVLNILLL